MKIIRLFFYFLFVLNYANAQLTSKKQTNLVLNFFTTETGNAIKPDRISVMKGNGEYIIQLDNTQLISSKFTVPIPFDEEIIIEVEKKGYKSMQIDVFSTNTESLTYNFNMTPIVENNIFSNYSYQSNRANTIILGYVSDIDGQPISNAIVRDSTTNTIVKTDYAGFFILIIPIEKTNNFTQTTIFIEKEGYTEVKKVGFRVYPNGFWKTNIKLDKGLGQQIEWQLRPEDNSDNFTDTTECKECRKKKFSRQSQVSACTIPQTIIVGSNCTGGAGSCTTYTPYNLEYYVKCVLAHEWDPNWGNWPSLSNKLGMNALKAGAIAIRSYAINYINNPPSSFYNICNTTYCQVFTASFNEISNPAVEQTAGYVLTNSSGTVVKSEFAAETNDKYSPAQSSYPYWGQCGDGKFQKSVNGPPINSGGCYPTSGTDPLCLGKTIDGHTRGMCQRGTARWATGLTVPSNTSMGVSNGQATKTWQQLLTYYYPYYTLSTCTIIPAPPNDNCTSATPITSNGPCKTGQTIAGATTSYGANLCEGCSCTSPDDNDVYYSFVAQATSHTVTVSNYASNFDAVIELRTACGSGTAISCYDPTGSPTSVPKTWSNLTIGNTYYVRVFEFNNNGTPPSSPTFDICVTHNSTSCITPGIPISVVGTQTGQTTASLSWSAGSPVGSSTVTYYWVVGTSSSVTYGNGIAQGSTTGTSASATGLAAGSTYYLRVYANTSCNNTSSNYGTSSTFTTTTLCTTPGTPTSVSGSHTGPTTANLSWSAGSPTGSPTVTYFWVIGTSSLVTYGNGVVQGSTTGTSVSATGLSTGVTYYLRVYANTNCNNTSSNYGTSFAFATSTTCITPGTPINLSGSPTGQTTANLSWAAGNPVGSLPVTYYWVVGTSPSVTWANGVAQNTTRETFAFATGLTSGTTYYLRVYATTDCYNTSSNYGTSSAFITNSGGGVPPNDNCSGATTLLVNSTCNYLTNQTTTNATAEFPPSTCSGFSSTFGYDVWYKFVANSTNQTIKVLGGLVFDSVVGLYSSCSSNSLIDCIDATVIEEEETLNVSGLTVGTTYYVRVYNFGGQVGTFAICVVGTSQQNPPGNFNITLTPQCNGATSRVYVQWTQASNATNYDIYRNGTPYYSNAPYDQTGFYDNGVVSGVIYTYKVVAKNTGGNTDNSNGTLQATALNCSCIDNPTLPTYYNGNVVQIKAPNTINATNKINTGANILFQAGKTIYLNPGFIVEQGAIFIAQMGGCNN